MKYIYPINRRIRPYLILSSLAGFLSLIGSFSFGQSCPGNSVKTITSYPNTYYPGTSTSLSVGATSITLGAASYGTAPIAKGDVLLIMQMQGAGIAANNNATYGSGAGTSGSGYLTNASLMAGNMEYIVADTAVPTTGGTLTLKSGLVHQYQNSAYNGTNGQYTYQIIRVPLYYDLKLGGSLAVPAWNGTSGGVMVLYAVDSIEFNGQKIFASGTGFRGGSAPKQGPGTGTIANTDYITTSANNTNGPKGEGIAGTPMWVAGSSTGVEGYPGGSWARGAPGNAGGGGTDGNPSSNNENTGGGGGGNAGPGGGGGLAWSSGDSTGGKGGAIYTQASPSSVVLGGGGGSGTNNDGTGTPAGGYASGGAAGGGIVIAVAGTAFSGTTTIDVSGASGSTTVLNDGSGGGGAGGSVILYAGSSGVGLANVTIYASGGTGGSNNGLGAKHGPGGGGGGGYIFANGAVNAASFATGGKSGFTAGNVSYGASAGSNGTTTTNITESQLSAFPVTCSILATSFISVTAQQQNGQVVVDWTMANETSASQYLVEKSPDGRNFTTTGSVASKASGSVTTNYDFTDNNGFSSTGIIYYRVKEVEWSGAYLYSQVVSVNAGSLESKLSVYPNPARQSATVNFVSASGGAISLKLIDLKGSILWQTQYQATAGVNTFELSAIRNVPEGLYLLQWFDGLKPETVKLMVEH